MRSVLWVTVALAALGCTQPAYGEPCTPGSGCVFDEISTGYGTYRGCVLECGGPSGCEGPHGFTWGGGPLIRYDNQACGCDGQSMWPTEYDDSIGTFDGRWRFHGSCEDPCADVRFFDTRYFTGWGYRPSFSDGEVFTPVAPQCAQCQNAEPAVAGEPATERCETPEGVGVSSDCCDCTRPRIADDGRCVHDALGYELSASCCDPPPPPP